MTADRDDTHREADLLVELLREVKSLAASVNTLAARVAGFEATLRESKMRHEEELRLLFASREEHSKRLAQIERDYVPRGDCRVWHERNQEEHDRYAGQIQAQAVTLGKVAAIASLIATAASALLQAAMHKFGGGT